MDWRIGDLVAGIVGLGVPVGTYLTVRRQRSGRIQTTEAADLWSESTKLRQELRAELEGLRERVRELEVENTELRVQIRLLGRGLT
jgi:predicted nuclease with TOPRIM domain